MEEHSVDKKEKEAPTAEERAAAAAEIFRSERRRAMRFAAVILVVMAVSAAIFYIVLARTELALSLPMGGGGRELFYPENYRPGDSCPLEDGGYIRIDSASVEEGVLSVCGTLYGGDNGAELSEDDFEFVRQDSAPQLYFLTPIERYDLFAAAGESVEFCHTFSAGGEAVYYIGSILTEDGEIYAHFIIDAEP